MTIELYATGPGAEARVGEATAKTLRALAYRMDAKLENLRRPMTQNSTPKRNKQYQQRLWEAENLERTQRLLRAIADATDSGTLPAILEGVRTATAAAPLVHKGLGSGGYYEVIRSRDYWDTSAKGKAAQALIEEAESPDDAKRRAEREKAAKITKMEEELRFTKIPGFFPTPKPIIDKMMAAADIQPGQSVLEPSAGTGSIADIIRDVEPQAELSVVEVLPALRDILKAKGYSIVGSDFMEQDGQYDRILMNPPFEREKGIGYQDIAHVRHAYDVLKPGGRLVAIMSEGSFSGGQKQRADFAAWLDEVGGTSEKLDPRSFKGIEAFRQTGVSVRVVTIDKAHAVGKPAPAQAAKGAKS